MDLTQSYPRSPVDRLNGIDHLKRMIDKAKAHNAGTFGEYRYNCPMDQMLLDHLGLDSALFASIVERLDTDPAIYAELEKRVPAALAPEAKLRFNALYEAAAPDTPEKQAYFDSLLQSIAPGRKDIKTWVRLLDLDEKRPVPVIP
jgi:hypothetical protein